MVELLTTQNNTGTHVMTYLERLRQELDLPLYGSMSDQEALDELEAVNKTQAKSFMSSMEILDQQNDADYLLLTDAKKDRWLRFISSIQQGGADPYNHAMVQIIKEIWGNASQTVQNLAAARDEQVSRLQQLSISNITVSDITAARAL